MAQLETLNKHSDLNVLDGANGVQITNSGKEFTIYNGGYNAISVAGAAGDTTLTEAQYNVSVIKFTGVLTGNRGVILPLTAGIHYIFENATTGAFSLTVKGASGAGVAITQTKKVILYCDGTDWKAATAEL